MNKTIIVIILISLDLLAAVRPGFFEGDDYSPDSLETIVRLRKSVEAYGGNYAGLDLMFETRDKVDKRTVWAAEVNFGSKTGETSVNYGKASKVKMIYMYAPRYFETERTYGENSDSQDDFVDKWETPSDHFYIFRVARDFGERESKDVYKKWMKTGLFEWTLPQPKTLRDIINQVKSLKIEKRPWFGGTTREEFPDHVLSEQNPTSTTTMNCVTFCTKILRMNHIDLYDLNWYSSGFWRGIKKGSFVLGGVAVVGGAGFLGGPPLAAAVATAIASKAVGAAVGAAMGYGAEIHHLAIGSRALVREVYDNRVVKNARRIMWEREGRQEHAFGVYDIDAIKDYRENPTDASFAVYNLN